MRKKELIEATTERDLLEFFADSYEHIRRRHGARRKNKALMGYELARRRTGVVDDLISRTLDMYGYSDLSGVAVVALGGYGRSELSPCSDIDLLFLHRKDSKQIAEDITRKLTYLLWDTKMDVGNCTRSVEECLELSTDRADTTILSSLLDARFVCGDEDVYRRLDREMYDELLPSMASDFIKRKKEEADRRGERYGKTLYILEPNVKEGRGGLREFQTAMWIAQVNYKVRKFDDLLQGGFITEKEYSTARKCVNFILMVRAQLHYQAGKREDNLTFQHQKRAAEFFGYRDGRTRAVEKFMRIYYLRAAMMVQQSRRITEKCIRIQSRRSVGRKTTRLDYGFTMLGKYLSVTSRNVFSEDFRNFMRAFEYADRYSLEFSEYLDVLMTENIFRVDEKVRNDPVFNSMFLRLLRSANNVSKILLKMNEIRLLGRMIPEFGKIVCMVQFNSYHVYTVDIHSIFMVREIEKLLNYEYEDRFPLLTKIGESIVRRHILFLACLFHDMGKGRGGSHAQKGAAMIPGIAERLGLADSEKEQLEFLVRHHLAMVEFSQKRDLSDSVVIGRLAKAVPDEETLSLLYLLTVADIRSVGPDVWKDWTGTLLQELYVRTLRHMAGSTYRRKSPQEWMEKMTEDIAADARGEIPAIKVRKILKHMPVSYFSRFSRKTVLRHVKFLNSVEGRYGTEVIRYQEHDEFTVCTPSREGIFSVFCGVLSANGLNILGARIITTLDKKALDIFYVDKVDRLTDDEHARVWDKVRRDLESVLGGDVDVDELVEKRKRNYASCVKEVPQYPPEIVFDNDSSENATIIEVYANDREGLLYGITKTIYGLGLSIEYAKISTRADQAADTFYVRDAGGGKVTESEELERIESSLMEAVTGEQ